MGLKISKLLMRHFPETLNLVVCVNAPRIFDLCWSVLRTILDDRLRSKVLFLSGNTSLKDELENRFGTEASEWLLSEMEDNELKREASEYKKYWIAPENELDHNPCGFPSYVSSEWYIKTPGDAYEENRKGN